MARPKEFDPEDALEQAMHQFWAKGYFDSSIRDLVDRTGVNYYGLYSVFDSKHGLFLAALDKYRRTVTSQIIAAITSQGPVLGAMEKTFQVLLRLMETDDGAVGCLMCNTAVELAAQDEAVAARVRDHLALLRDSFTARLTAAQKSGELAADRDTKAMGEFLATTVYSVALLVRSGQNRSLVKRHIRTSLSLLG